MRNPFTKSRVRSFVAVLQGQLLLCTILGCGASPCVPPPVEVREDPVVRHVARTKTEPASTAVPAPQTSAVQSAIPRSDGPAARSRVTIDYENAIYFVDFPTSISEDGNRIAAMISLDDESEKFYKEWLVVKDLSADRILHEVDLIDKYLSTKLYRCRGDEFDTCYPGVRPELQRNIDTANALLAKDRWKPFPCIRILGWPRPERMGPGCELLKELDFEYEVPNLIVSRGDLRVATMLRPAWSPNYRKPACEGVRIDPRVESVAFDPETGLFVISLRFLGPEGNFECPTPRWDFHPILMPKFRQRPAQHPDGDAPPPVPVHEAEERRDSQGGGEAGRSESQKISPPRLPASP